MDAADCDFTNLLLPGTLNRIGMPKVEDVAKENNSTPLRIAGSEDSHTKHFPPLLQFTPSMIHITAAVPSDPVPIVPVFNLSQ